MTITLVKNQGLDDAATSTRTSSINEPTVIEHNGQVMMTGNWFASASADDGANWSFVDPFTAFPASAGGFCCDQIVQYNPGSQIWIWLLQYCPTPNCPPPTPTGNNIFRLAICRAATFGQWYYWDFSPASLNAAWTNVWFDYPDMACTGENLFVSFNAFADVWQRAVVFRFPLADLAAGTNLGYRWWTTTDNGSLKLCRGAGPVMYFGSHNSTSQLRVYSWPDNATSVTSNDVNVRSWTEGRYSAPGPGGVEWLGRVDGRITAAWVAGGVIGFMWSANRDTNHPLPYIRVACIDENTKALTSEPDIWSQNSAWAYPAAAPNQAGQVGISAFLGGGARHPGHVVGAKTATGWDTQFTSIGTDGPSNGSWGDYLACQAHPDTGTDWIASGYTLQGGNARQNVEPRVVQFRV